MPPETRAGDSPTGDAPPPEDASEQHDITQSDAAGSPVDAATSAATESTTAGGYSYTVIDDEDAAPGAPDITDTDTEQRRWRRMLPWLAAAIIPTVIVGVLVWFFASGGSGGSTAERQNADVTSLLNLVGNQQGASIKRYEGSLAPGYPDGVPVYPNARPVSSIKQVKGQDAQYLAVYGPTDCRPTVPQSSHRHP